MLILTNNVNLCIYNYDNNTWVDAIVADLLESPPPTLANSSLNQHSNSGQNAISNPAITLKFGLRPLL